MSRPKSAYPPTHHHPSLTLPLSPATAQSHLATFLALSQRKPHLHPDSQLSSTGIKFSAHSGPSGGLALHHLRRIEAGLRGENLAAETEEELARFDSTGVEDGAELPEGDDSRLDAVMHSGKRKRKREEAIEDWAEETSSQAGAYTQELESFANTPLHSSSYALWDGAQGQEEYEEEQEVLFGDVGGEEREGAPVVRQGGEAPGLVTRGVNGSGKVGKSKTENDKLARKAAKKARQMALKLEKARAGKG